LAWSLWLATFGCCGGGLVVTLALTRPLTLGVLAEGAVFALAFPPGFATIGLVITLRLPANPIGWLYAAAGLAWSWNIPLEPWVEQLLRDHRPLPLAAQVVVAVAKLGWAPPIALSGHPAGAAAARRAAALAPLARGGGHQRGRCRHGRGGRQPGPGTAGEPARWPPDRQPAWAGGPGRHGG